MLCGTERLDNYNRDNLSIFNVEEETPTVNGRKIGEYVTIQKVVTLDSKVEASVTDHGISIAHRVPTLNERSQRPIIARFCRRMAKINILKIFLRENPELENIKRIRRHHSSKNSFYQNDERLIIE